jgi:hypothetical protein
LVFVYKLQLGMCMCVCVDERGGGQMALSLEQNTNRCDPLIVARCVAIA